MILIDNYTGNWQSACSPSVPKIGTLFRVSEEPDAREWDDFRRVAINRGRDFQFVRWMPRLKLNVYRIINAH